MDNFKDPLEIGAHPIPDVNAPLAHEALILQNMALVLTREFICKILTYIKPIPGSKHSEMFITLIADILKVAAISMEMSKPLPDVPKDFDSRLENASKRIEDLLTNGIEPEYKAEIEANMYALTQLGMSLDIFDVLNQIYPKPPQ